MSQMAVVAARAMQIHEEPKNIHPFFEKSYRIPPESATSNDTTLPVTAEASQSHEAAPKTSGLSSPECSKGIINSNPNVPEATRTATNVKNDALTGPKLLDFDMNESRRKRQRRGSLKDEVVETTVLEELERSFPLTRDGGNIDGEDPEANHNTNVSSDNACLPQERTSSDIQYSGSLSQGDAGALSPKDQHILADDLEPLAPNLGFSDDIDAFAASHATVESGSGGGMDKSDSMAAQDSPKRVKKILRLNPKTGTIGSPPTKKKQKPNLASVKFTSSKGNKRSQSLLVVFKYGGDKTIRSKMGKKIDEILINKRRFLPSETLVIEPVKPTTKIEPLKSTHPFFLGKAALELAAPTTNTPVAKVPALNVEPEALIHPIERPVSPAKRPVSSKAFPTFNNFGSGVKLTKFPGALDPIWPPSCMIHIRGLSENQDFERPHRQVLPSSAVFRKSKYIALDTCADEDILRVIAKTLRLADIVESVRQVELDRFSPCDPCLRIPAKHFETGIQLQQRMKSELLSRVTGSGSLSSSDDELQKDIKNDQQIHPALAKAFNSISTSLTAFDRSTYETQSWIHKYAPTAAAEVLHCGREPFILKEWLQSLTITAVDTGGVESSRSRATSVASRRSVASKPEKIVRRKRKARKLEGFVVSSDDEAGEMDEISEPDDDLTPRGSQGLLKKTVVRAGDAVSKDSNRFVNAVVVSGPHGCGKTATIYAVAQELGFEVFEINSSSRRSGKDIMDKVGDMTRNHLVQSAVVQGLSLDQDDDLQRVSDAFDADLKSGRQGTMKSFFKPQATTMSKSLEPPRGRKKRQTDEGLAIPSTGKVKLPTQQKQSLILFEEVDVLFEEDKQFWATIMSLLLLSKRPIIMTCSDETVVPLQALSLHAIIRLAPPPVDLAVDYLLSVAANEGHALQRKAVKALYQSHRFDFRATMTELEFWCQIGIGDRRGGFDWFFPRLPAGIDKDPYGNTIRVVSEGTYKLGMGWLLRDFLEDKTGMRDFEEELHREAWDGWQLDISDCGDAINLTSSIKKAVSSSLSYDRAALDAYGDFADLMSVADNIAGGLLAQSNKPLLDIQVPPLSAKAREDFVLGYELLEAETAVSYSHLSLEISWFIRSHCRQELENDYVQLVGSNSSDHHGLSERQILSTIIESRVNPTISLTRHDLSVAFDPIASQEQKSWNPTALEPSAFDRPTSMIASEIAPYVRSIVAYDSHLQQERAKLSNLLSAGGRSGKRMRTTRSAMSALEGGKRNTTRRERWFGDALNKELVLKTGLQTWLDAAALDMLELKTKSDAGGTEEDITKEGLSPADSTAS